MPELQLSKIIVIIIYRKLDYILFQIENRHKEMKIKYGSGLQGKNPSKSPLYQNFKLNLVGDTYSDVESPEAID
jgi:hypothetical protein